MIGFVNPIVPCLKLWLSSYAERQKYKSFLPWYSHWLAVSKLSWGITKSADEVINMNFLMNKWFSSQSTSKHREITSKTSGIKMKCCLNCWLCYTLFLVLIIVLLLERYTRDMLSLQQIVVRKEWLRKLEILQWPKIAWQNCVSSWSEG